MKHILLFGAGKSATVLIGYLKNIAVEKQWRVTVADIDLAVVQAKVGEHAWVKAVGISIEDETARHSLVQDADVVISLLPPALHAIVAIDCLAFGKHLLTASYVDDSIKLLANNIKQKGILFLCEMGLDPGIDHMSAMQLIHRIKNSGGKITSFISHCGGLVAPESDTNPWHYKISWNPRSVVMAGKAGGVFREKSGVRSLEYEELFVDCKEVFVEGIGQLAFYPNRDSLSYIPVYELEEAETFMRTTLRYPDFCKGWNTIVKLGLTDEKELIDSDGLSVSSFLRNAFLKKGISLDDDLLKKQFSFLGWDDDTVINKGRCSSADILQSILEIKWALEKHDKDMIVMLHEMEYVDTVNSEKLKVKSELVVKGEDSLQTAMAKTVGLPLGIAATLLLEGKISETGLHIPTIRGIYEPVLKSLAEHGIAFRETA